MLREMELMNMEDKQFEDYATKVINYMEHHGRNVYPMKRVRKLAKTNNTLKGSLILFNLILQKQIKVVGDSLNVHVVTSNEKLSEAAAIKKHQQDIPTKKNLGFG